MISADDTVTGNADEENKLIQKLNNADDLVTGNADEENKLIQKLNVGKLQIIMHGQILRKKLQRQFTCCNLAAILWYISFISGK
jgi:hydroxymethylpyrimidine/phosphomethylpyrimidine kinase